MSTMLVGRENLPNVYIKEITINSLGNGLSISSLIHLYDEPNGGWYSEEILKTNLKIMVVLSSNVDFNNSLTTGRSALTPQHINKISGYNTKDVHYKTFAIGCLNKQAYKNILDNGHMVFPYKCSFKIPEKQHQDVSVFAVCYLDSKQFGSQNNLDLSTSNVSAYHGAIVGEQVLVDSQTPTQTNMFIRDGSKNAHVGPIHRQGVDFREGSKGPGRVLNVSSIRNTKIKDYRMVFPQKRRNKKNIKRKSTFSNLYTSIDYAGTLKGTFDINMEELFLQTSAYARLLHSLDKNLYNLAVENIVITDLSLYVQKVRVSKQSSKLTAGKVKLTPVGTRRKIISSKETQQGIFAKKDEKTEAEIKEIDINYGVKNQENTFNRRQRTICFSQKNDRFTRGKNVYSVRMEYKDPTEKIIIDMLETSADALSSLKSYKQRISRATNYNYYANQTTRNLTEGTSRNELWMSPLTQFMKMYTLMFDTSNVDIERMMGNLITMLHPRTLSVRSVEWFYERYSFVYNRMTKYFNNINISMAPTVKLGYVQGDTSRGKVVMLHKFNEIVDFSEQKVSVSFMPLPITGRLSDKDVFPTISYSDYRAIVRAERNRFLNGDPTFTPQTVPHLKESMVSHLNNVEYSAYTYFSPSLITSGTRSTVDLSNLETVVLKEFNRLYNNAKREQRSINFDHNTMKKQDIQAGRRSSFYIKEQRREAEEIEEYKPSDENLGSESNFNSSQKEETRIDSPSADQDIKNRFNAYDRAKASNFSISFEEYDLKNQNNILAAVADRKLSEAKKKKALRDIPLHLKALMGSEYGFSKNNIFYGHEDLMQDTRVRDIIKTCFLTLVKVQYLEEYKDHNLGQAVWRDMTSYSFNKLIVSQKKSLLCRLVPFDDNVLKIEGDFFERIGIENKYFFISDKSETASLQTNGSNEPIRIGDPQTDLIVRPENRDKSHYRFMIDFMANANLDMTTVSLGSRTIVVSQPQSKNGPLGAIDYQSTNDLMRNTNRPAPDSAPSATASTPSVTPTGGMSGGGSSTGGSY